MRETCPVVCLILNLYYASCICMHLVFIAVVYRLTKSSIQLTVRTIHSIYLYYNLNLNKKMLSVASGQIIYCQLNIYISLNIGLSIFIANTNNEIMQHGYPCYGAHWQLNETKSFILQLGYMNTFIS